MNDVAAIRDERREDHVAVKNLHLTCFPTAVEADLVDRLREDGDAAISLVAIEAGAIVGHVLFSPMRAKFKALGLAPVAVEEAYRRRGIAADLIRTGIARAQAAQYDAVFVLGDVDYYRRFGFDADLAKPVQSPYAGPHFMALALHSGASAKLAGRVDYARAFDGLG